MSGVKPQPLAEFYRRFHGRGLTAEILAEFIGRDRVTVSRILSGARRRGPVWAKIAPLLTAEERRLLDVAHSATWNTRNILRRPSWRGVAQAHAA